MTSTSPRARACALRNRLARRGRRGCCRWCCCRQGDHDHILFGQPGGAQHGYQVVVRGGESRRQDSLALQVRQLVDARGTSRNQPIEAFGDGHDDAQVWIRHGFAQQLRFGVGCEIGRFRSDADHAACRHRQFLRIETLRRHHHGRQLDPARPCDLDGYQRRLRFSGDRRKAEGQKAEGHHRCQPAIDGPLHSTPPWVFPQPRFVSLESTFMKASTA